MEDGIVPMIPKQFWFSKIVREDMNDKNDEMIKITKQALNNPLVPLGMVATVGCLIGK